MKNYFHQLRILGIGARPMSNFFVQTLRGEPITLYCDSTQTPSFFYLEDLIEGFCA